MMSRPAEGMAAIQRALDKRFPLSGVKNSDQYRDGAGRMGNAWPRIRMSVSAFVWGLLASR